MKESPHTNYGYTGNPQKQVSTAVSITLHKISHTTSNAIFTSVFGAVFTAVFGAVFTADFGTVFTAVFGTALPLSAGREKKMGCTETSRLHSRPTPTPALMCVMCCDCAGRLPNALPKQAPHPPQNPKKDF